MRSSRRSAAAACSRVLAARCTRSGLPRAIYAAEPETAAPLAASLRAGEPRRFDAWQASFVDGAGGRSVLPTMWPLLAPGCDESMVVSLDEAARGDEARRRTERT